MTTENKIDVGVCDVCMLLDGDQRIKPVTWCRTCESWLCMGCVDNWGRRARAGWKRAMRRFIGATSVLTIAVVLSVSAHAVVYDLACPSGTSVLAQTVVPATGHFRAYLCVNAFGVVTSPVFGAGAVLGSGTATDVAFWLNATTLTKDDSFTFIDAAGAATVTLGNSTTTYGNLLLGSVTAGGPFQVSAISATAADDTELAFLDTTSFEFPLIRGTTQVFFGGAPGRIELGSASTASTPTTGALNLCNATGSACQNLSTDSSSTGTIFHLPAVALANATVALVGRPVISAGTKFTSNGGCSETALVGGASAGKFVSGTTGVCTLIVTIGDAVTATNGWACYANDLTTPADLIHETATNTNTFTLSGTTISGDVINFGCMGY